MPILTLESLAETSMEYKLLDWFQNTKEYKEIHKFTNYIPLGKISPHNEEEFLSDTTKMIYLDVINRYRNLEDKHEYFVLLMSALCCKLGKPMSRSINKLNHAVKTFNYENISIFMTINVFYKYIKNGCLDTIFKMTNKDMSDILFIVGNQEMFKYRKDLDVYRVYADKMNLVYKFALSEDSGRICRKKFKRDLSIVEKCLNTYEEYKSTLKNEPKENSIIFIGGVPCSGKTTFIKNKVESGEYNEGYVLSRDDIIENLYVPGIELGNTYTERFENITKHGLHKKVDDDFKYKFTSSINRIVDQNLNIDIVIDKTNLNSTSRVDYSKGHNIEKIARQNMKKFKKVFILMCTPLKIVFKRNDKRFKNTGKFISEDIILNMIKSASIPSYEEFDEIVYEFCDELKID